MNNSNDVYRVQGKFFPEQKALYYYFVSSGKRNLIKVVQYNYIKQFNNRPLFNLGFADYDHKTGRSSDKKISGNDDHYRVFNTVLYTIPKLFDVYKDGVVIVRGSDSTPAFIENCKKTCVRKCDDLSCKKAHRRISIYRNFVNKHFELLNQEFAFHGTNGMDDHIPTEPYEKGKDYRGIIVEKRLN